MMSHAKRTRRLTLASRDTLLQILETLPGILFVVDDATMIVYANARAQAMLGTTPEALRGNSFWRCAPHLVSTPLYQAVQQAKQTREPTEVVYVSPVTNSWMHVSLSPTDEGLSIFFQEQLEPPQLQDVLSWNGPMYRDLLESVADEVTIVTPEGLILDVNQHLLADAGLQREEVVGKALTDLPAWSHDPAVQEHLRAAIVQASQGETVCFEARIHPRIGLSLDILMTITAYHDANQRVEYLICTGRDITERKHSEDELRTLVDAIPHLVWIARPDGSITYNNQRLIDHLAMTLEQVEGDGWMDGVHPDDKQRVWDAWQSAIHTGLLYEAEFRMQDGTSGAYRWFLVRGVPRRDAQGTILSWVGTATDIDAQKQAEERIKASEQNFRILAETVPHLVWTMLPDGRLDYTNQRCRDWAQTDSEHLRDYGWRPFVHPDDFERMFTLRQQALERSELYENEYRLRNGQTNEYHWFLARAYPVYDDAGQIIKWFGTSTDIDEQKRMAEALRQSQAQMQALMASTVIGIFISEGERREVIEANETFLRMTGYTRDDVQHRRLNGWDITALDSMAVTKQAHAHLDRHAYIIPYEKEYIGKDGSSVPVVVGGVVTQQNPCQAIYFVLDNSARKELEQRKDDFISMASHELRNPLAALKMQTQLVQKRLERQSHHEAATALSRVERPIKQLERLIGELLDVSKIQAGRLEYIRETVDLDALLQEITETVQQTSPSHTIVVRGTVGTSLIGDRDRLGQVFTNLLSNAIKYSPDAEMVEMDLSTSPELVTVRVHDHGLGIPREQREKIFDRFYRVADPKRNAIPGLGMGLYIVAEIVKHHEGTITVESAIGKGSTFMVTLPRMGNA